MKILMCGMLLLAMTGCVSDQTAYFLTTEQIQNDIDLRKQKNIQGCGKLMVTGNMGALTQGANGSLQGVVSFGATDLATCAATLKGVNP